MNDPIFTQFSFKKINEISICFIFVKQKEAIERLEREKTEVEERLNNVRIDKKFCNDGKNSEIFLSVIRHVQDETKFKHDKKK